MKILYSVQATGNGHISRAMELLPFLQKYGEVDIFLSGANSTLSLDAPIKYRSKGISLFYTCTGSLDFTRLVKNFHPAQLWKEVNELPVEKYDLVLNDFDSVTAMACARKKKASVNFGHQASFMSEKTPRPGKKSFVGEWILKNYAKANQYIGLHFDSYDDFIYSPVIKSEILNAEPTKGGYITVYLPAYCDQILHPIFSKHKDVSFQIFSHQRNEPTRIDNITYIPVGKQAFNESLIHCDGLITGGGFETPAEAIALKKKLIAIPIKGQYEQQCNAAALRNLGVKTFDDLGNDFKDGMNDFLYHDQPIDHKYHYSTQEIVDLLMAKCANMDFSLDFNYPELMFN
ncbi:MULTISPECIES: glycosyltransferase family protein [unclassified Paraflavitalea]|uniref:glycosyltransferase family protein n=1 Tax=unclassified Paraflavitalea TaxID=2798305 RepID=UPI003D3326DC